MQHGWTALMKAAHGGRKDCVRLLIDAGADTDAKNTVRVGRCVAGVLHFSFYFPRLTFHRNCFCFNPSLFLLCFVRMAPCLVSLDISLVLFFFVVSLLSAQYIYLTLFISLYLFYSLLLSFVSLSLFISLSFLRKCSHFRAVNLMLCLRQRTLFAARMDGANVCR